MSGGKGSKPAGNVTMTNLTGQKQEPYLEEIWKGAQGLYDKYTPGSLTADQGIPWQRMGLQNQADTAGMVQQEWMPRVYEPWLSTAGQKYTDSPAYNYYQSAAQPGQGWYATSPQQQLADLAQAGFNGGRYGSESIRGWGHQLGANNNLGLSQLGQIAQGQGLGMQQLGQTAQGRGTGMEQLGQAASGAYLGGNPYFASMVQNALDPITRNYQTAIAPQLDSNFAASGRYGSGAMVGQRGNAQNQLADQLAKTSSGMYGQNYANERQQQDAAAQQYAGLQNQAGSQYAGLQNQAGSQYGSLWNQGLSGAGQLEKASSDQYMNSLSQGANMAAQRAGIQNAATAGLQSGYNAGNQNAISAASLYPQLTAASFLPSQQIRDAGAGVNAIQQQYIDEPYKALELYKQAVGNPIGAGTSQPYFQNQGANIMSGITGGLDIMSKMGGMLGKI